MVEEVVVKGGGVLVMRFMIGWRKHVWCWYGDLVEMIGIDGYGSDLFESDFGLVMEVNDVDYGEWVLCGLNMVYGLMVVLLMKVYGVMIVKMMMGGRGMNDGSRRKGGYAPVLFLFFPFCFLLFFGLWVVISMCVSES
jgi:hypothetical protein